MTWNPVTGCDQVSPGCDHCYALTLAKRLKAMGAKRYQNDGDPRTSGPGFGLTMHPELVGQPLSWRKPRMVFVNSMSDLFHPKVTDEFIAGVWATMALTPQHTYQVLTKRHGRMRSLLSNPDFRHQVNVQSEIRMEVWTMGEHTVTWPMAWPLPNVWLGVSVEDQKRADLRIPALLDTPATVRFLSCEPLLAPVALSPWICNCGSADDYGATHDTCDACTCPRYVVDHSDPDRHHPENIDREEDPDCPAHHRPLHWVICGGESGPGHRPIDPDWVRSLRDQCTAAGVPFFFKQWGGARSKTGGKELDGRTWTEMPTVRRRSTARP